MSDQITMRERVAEEVRSLLARRRMSASELARQLETTQRYMSRRLTGETAFDVDDLDRIATVLGVQVTDLLPRRSEGELVTVAGSRVDAGRRTNDRSVVAADRPHLVGHTNRSHPADATRRPARTHPAHA